MEILLPLIVVIIIPLAATIFWKHHVTIKEAILQIVLVSIMVLVTYYVGSYQSLSDTELLNGQITNKQSEKVSCEHSYSCHCRTSCSGGKTRTCSTVCQTCYEHSYDVDWNLKTDLNRTITIDRVSRQGLKEPPRFTLAKIGDPVVVKNSYQNYIKAAGHNIINPGKVIATEQYAKYVPKYPLSIYDYHYLDRVIINKRVDKKLSLYLANSLKKVGKLKQANIIIVVSNAPTQDFRYAVESKWLGGKKNDIIVLVNDNFQWADVITLAGNKGNEFLTVQIRDDIIAYGKIDEGLVDIIVRDTLKYFDRLPMDSLKYLKEQAEVPFIVLLLCYSIAVFGSIGLTFYFHRNDTI